MNEVRTKYCSFCKEDKAISFFHKNKTMKDGVNSLCKECFRAKYQQVDGDGDGGTSGDFFLHIKNATHPPFSTLERRELVNKRDKIMEIYPFGNIQTETLQKYIDNYDKGKNIRKTYKKIKKEEVKEIPEMITSGFLHADITQEEGEEMIRKYQEQQEQPEQEQDKV